MRCLVLLAVLVCIAVVSALPTKKVRYDNYKVFRIVPKTEEQLEFIQRVSKRWNLLDFWQPPSQVGRAVDVMVPPVEQLDFLNSMAKPGLPIETWISDVQSMIDEEAESIASRVSSHGLATFNYDVYHSYEEISTWMDDIVNNNPLTVSKVEVSETYEKKTIYGLEIKKNRYATKYAYIQGGIHAREWISPATMLYLTSKYLDNYDEDVNVKAFLDNFILIIVPVLNIDGYKYSWTNDRMWRKNRNADGNVCNGVDLNRNYDFQWSADEGGPCTETYPGTGALSEPETSGSKAFLAGLGANLKLFIDFHAYGQLWLYPWGFTRSKLIPNKDIDAQHAVAINVENAISSKYNENYFVGESGPDMYPANGASEDFGYGSLGVKYSYVVELRDEGKFGFTLPERFISPTAEEIYAGMVELGNQLVEEYA